MTLGRVDSDVTLPRKRERNEQSLCKNDAKAGTDSAGLSHR